MLPTEHREKAIALLEAATAHAMTSPVRATVLAEAQVHATLSLAPTPIEVRWGEAVACALAATEEAERDGHDVVAELATSTAPSTPSPSPPRRSGPRARASQPASLKETS